MKYLLQRVDKKYVAPAGSKRSYTSKQENARRFDTREEAERERCVENERIISLE